MVRRLHLMGIEIRGSEDNHVADPPASGVQDFNRVAACSGGLGQLRPGVRPVTVQVQGSTHHHDPAITAVIRSTGSLISFVFDVQAGEGTRRLARVGFGFRANLQLSVHHDPLGGQFKIFIIREAQFAVDHKLRSAGGVTSRTTSMSLSMVTTASLAGTFLSGQVDVSDQRFALAVDVSLLRLNHGISAEA